MMKSFEDKCGQKLNLSELLMSPARLKEATAQKLVSRVCSKKILVKKTRWIVDQHRVFLL